MMGFIVILGIVINCERFGICFIMDEAFISRFLELNILLMRMGVIFDADGTQKIGLLMAILEQYIPKGGVNASA
jgi:hypothetical protein